MGPALSRQPRTSATQLASTARRMPRVRHIAKPPRNSVHHAINDGALSAGEKYVCCEKIGVQVCTNEQ